MATWGGLQMDFDGMTREQLIIELAAKSKECEVLKKQVEEEQKKLLEERSNLRAMIEHLPDATIVIDKDKKVVAWNRAAEEMTGVSKENILGRCDYAYAVPFYGKPRPILIDLVFADDEETLKYYDTIEKRGNTIFADTYVPLLYEGRGAFMWGKASPLFDSNGALIGAIETIRDITERKSIEAQLKVERQRLFTLLDRLPAFVCLIAPDYLITYTNSNYRKRFGETEGKQCYEVYRGQKYPCKDCPTLTVLNTNNPVEWEWASPSGEVYQVYDYPFHDVDGSLLVLELLIDITERRRAEEALTESEARYRAIVEDQTELICRWSPSGKLTFVNEAYCCFFGKKSEELIGNGFMSLIYDDDRRKSQEQSSSPNWENPVATYEHRVIMPDGEIRWLQWSNRAVFNEQGQIVEFQGVGRDITERRMAEEALETERMRLFNLLDKLPAQVALFAPNYKIRFANRSFNEQICMPEGRYCYESIWRRCRPCDNCQTYRVFETNSPLEWELVFRGRTYHYYDYPFFDFDGSQLVLEIGIDITDLKQAMENLRLLEMRFSKAFNANPNVMSILSLVESHRDARFVDVNTSFERITGYHRDEIIGRFTSELGIWATPGDLVKVRGMILKQQEIRNLEINFRIKSGEIRVGLLSAEAMEFGGDMCLIVNVADITERKQIQKEMARLDRLNLVGEMAAGIGHEIRNPMTSVRGFLQLLQEKKEFSNHSDIFALMISELDRANSIITEFLSLAKNKAIQLKIINLNKIVGSLFPLIEADALITDKYIELELGDIPEVKLDEKEIRQLILNLVRNGIESMDPGGRMTVKTFKDGDSVVLAVQDQGKGIGPEVLEKLGTPFFTTKDNGTGLGLAVCYSIAARNNARIEVETGLTGTTFYVRFQIPK